MRKKIYFEEEIFQALDNQARGRINQYLSFVEALDISDNTRSIMRKFFLDMFNGYHRMIKKEIKRLIDE